MLRLERRAATIGAIIRKTFVIVVWAVAIVIVLRKLNFDIASNGKSVAK